MALKELLPTCRALAQADKSRLVQPMIVDGASDYGIGIGLADKPIPFWSQFDALEGASVIFKLLDKD